MFSRFFTILFISLVFFYSNTECKSTHEEKSIEKLGKIVNDIRSSVKELKKIQLQIGFDDGNPIGTVFLAKGNEMTQDLENDILVFETIYTTAKCYLEKKKIVESDVELSYDEKKSIYISCIIEKAESIKGSVENENKKSVFQ